MNEKKIYCLEWPSEQMKHMLMMTEEGFRLIHWLIDHEYLAEEVEIKKEPEISIHEV